MIMFRNMFRALLSSDFWSITVMQAIILGFFIPNMRPGNMYCGTDPFEHCPHTWSQIWWGGVHETVTTRAMTEAEPETEEELLRALLKESRAWRKLVEERLPPPPKP